MFWILFSVLSFIVSIVALSLRHKRHYFIVVFKAFAVLCVTSLVILVAGQFVAVDKLNDYNAINNRIEVYSTLTEDEVSKLHSDIDEFNAWYVANKTKISDPMSPVSFSNIDEMIGYIDYKYEG